MSWRPTFALRVRAQWHADPPGRSEASRSRKAEPPSAVCAAGSTDLVDSCRSWAHMRKDLGFDFCNTVSDENPLIAPPLRKTDCSLVSDGAAALVWRVKRRRRASLALSASGRAFRSMTIYLSPEGRVWNSKDPGKRGRTPLTWPV